VTGKKFGYIGAPAQDSQMLALGEVLMILQAIPKPHPELPRCAG
jgi:hypothetical protein